MPRPPRLVLPAIPLHVIQRGNNRTLTFGDAADYLWFLKALGRASERARCAIHAYVLMPNHVHLLLTTRDTTGPARLMQRLGREYVRYFNDRYTRTGTLWEGRFRSHLVASDEYFFRCSRYIEVNPVRAGMVDEPTEFRWSSYRGNASGANDPLLTPHPLYGALASTAARRAAAYRGMFDPPADERLLGAIRRAAKRGEPFGGAAFAQRMERLRRGGPLANHGGDRKSAAFARGTPRRGPRGGQARRA
jgi:putative transposase